MSDTIMTQAQISTLLSQIGGMNVLAICGGKRMVENGKLVMAAGAGYRVIVSLDSDDTYTVQRALSRKGQYIDKGTVHGVYSDQVGEASYQASCFHDGEFGDFSTKTVRSYA